MATSGDKVDVPPRPQPADATLYQASSSSASSSSPPRFITNNPFRRSSKSSESGSMLARLASATSFRAQSSAESSTEPHPVRPSIGSRISSRTSRKTADQTTANLEELSKPNGKFKSGFKWDSPNAPEPFMEASDTTQAERELTAALQSQSALASGSTAAAQTHAQNRGLGQPIFNERPSISSSSTPSPPSAQTFAQLPSVSQTISALSDSGVHPEVLGGSSSSAMRQESSHTATASGDSDYVPALENVAPDGDGTTPSMTPPPVKSREASYSEQGQPPNGDNHMVARAAQLVLEAARQQARAETRRKGKSAPASPKRSSFSLSPITTNSQEGNASEATGSPSNEANNDELSRTPSQRARSKSDAGGDAKIKRRKSFLRSMSSRTRRNGNSTEPTNDPGSETPTPSFNSLTSGTSSGSTTPGGRRRRYVDTRDLDLLARELAAEAIAEQLPQPPFARGSRSGSSSPLRSKPGMAAFNDPRRLSVPSILEDAPFQDDSITPVHPVSYGLKPMTPLHSSRPRARMGDALSMTGIGLPPDPINGLVPKEMFLGLGGSAYPSLPCSSGHPSALPLDNVDPFGIPLTQESSPFDATMAYANKTNVYHTPNQVAASLNQIGTSTWSSSQTSLSNKRRPVLTMTMNDPEAELQGLTKPPKNSGSKRLTPFGSRSSSRGSSPNPSFSNLKKEAADQKPSDDQGPPGANGDSGAESAAATSSRDIKELGAVAKSEGTLRPERAGVEMTSRRSSMAPSEMSTRPSLSPATSNNLRRLSTMFRRKKSKTQVDSVSPVEEGANKATTVATPEDSFCATPSGEAEAPTLSPQSHAISADSDADISPVAFRTLDLPSTQDSKTDPVASATNGESTARQGRPTSRSASRRSSMILDSNDQPLQKKRPIRMLLRRLSSFSSKSDKKEGAKSNSAKNSAKANFPDATTMPVVDMDKLKQLSEANGEKVDASLESSTDSKGVRLVDTADGTADDARQSDPIEAEVAPNVEALDLSHAAPALLNEEMARNGFGTRSAYKLRSSMDDDTKGEENSQMNGSMIGNGHEMAIAEDNTGPLNAEEEGKESTQDLAGEDGMDRSRAAQIMRDDSQTPSSEDSFFLGSGPSTTSRPGSGALMKHGSESAISEDLLTPDPSTTYLPSIKVEGPINGLRLEDATLSSTVTRVTAAAAVAAAAADVSTKAALSSPGPAEPIMTAIPN